MVQNEIVYILHNASSVKQKILNSGKGLQLSAIRVANKEGVSLEDYNQLGTSIDHLITNIRKDKKPTFIEDGEPGSSSYQDK